MECQYCKKILANEKSLYVHQRRAKLCLEKQEQKTINYLTCDCGKNFIVKRDYNNHINQCIIKANMTIENMKIEIQNLKDEIIKYKISEEIYKTLSNRNQGCIEEIAKQPRNNTSTTTNTNNNLMMMTPLDLNNKEHLTKTIQEHFDKKYMLDGQKESLDLL